MVWPVVLLKIIIGGWGFVGGLVVGLGLGLGGGVFASTFMVGDCG